jgi:hypothetical protein
LVTRQANAKSYTRTEQLSCTADSSTNALLAAHSVLDETSPDGTVRHGKPILECRSCSPPQDPALARSSADCIRRLSIQIVLEYPHEITKD